MELQITNKLKDYMQFAKELRKDKKEFNLLFKSMLILHFSISVIIYLFINILFRFNHFYYPTMPEFLIIVFVLLSFYFFFEYKSNFLFSLLHVKFSKPKLLTLENKYIELNSSLGSFFINSIVFKKFYETESFFALPLDFFGVVELILIKKDELNSEYIRGKLASIISFNANWKKSHNEMKSEIIKKYIFLFLVILLFLDVNFLFVYYPMDRKYYNQIFVSKLNFLYVDKNSEYWELGLRPYDIPISINGKNVVNLEPKQLEERLKGKNIKLKVLKRDTGKFMEYTIN